MGILISNSESKPAIVYDKVHMTAMQISQPIFNDDNSTPLYNVSISYRIYGVVDGVRYYKDGLERVGIEDYIALATQNLAQGDSTLFDALGSIEQAVSAILSEETQLVTTVN